MMTNHPQTGLAAAMAAAALFLPTALLTACTDDNNSSSGDTDGDTDGGTDGGTDGNQRQELVDLYEPQSMLFQAREYTGLVDGDPMQWNGPYMDPEPEEFTAEAAEFLTIYPRSYIPESDTSVFQTLADEQLWEALDEIGITLMHPIAFEQAGQIVGRELSPSIDGGFDRISMEIEPMMGEAEHVRELVRIAQEHGALVAGDIIPLHTGLGYDFRLAQMSYDNYPGIYDMVEVPQDMWDQLPPVEDEWGFRFSPMTRSRPSSRPMWCPAVSRCCWAPRSRPTGAAGPRPAKSRGSTAKLVAGCTRTCSSPSSRRSTGWTPPTTAA